MPNGKPGDHPLTDIVMHRMPMFGGEIDDKVRKLDAIVSNELRDVLATVVYFWPWGERTPTDPHALSAILDSLQRCAEKQARA
ncbi:hypothetical protein DW352_20050 [Pseudolabrys taiwanensis]|uniref:Uncharacterized protein n=1 Tax=Pseudolabrys taiwanensis TaxID=331696 RepID=A0A346A0B6_9HYPH|nr:hypothetical protein [Pseudolabrys taiwanensis]AXK82613.1 hypothetical protein DW352_20050 [Pseudolabrys taiwanensis]